ncbi:MAG TPA: ATP-binding cassette domain-containing protein [Geobacteraceae bacterium]|nr:ATP-binding cassette domain-containing protein [Geobacteraceae bacterium]
MTPPKQTPIIEVENLTAQYGDKVIFRDVSFQVMKGEILVILGGSGCGKSTLLKHMFGLYKPAAGRVTINGIDVTTEDEKALTTLRENIGVLFQSGALFGSMTLAENIALPLEEYTDLSREDIDRIVRMKLSMVNLAGFESLLPSELSGGMKKRAGLARAMALDPTVLFFDEPSAGLDPVTSAELDILMKRINTGLGTTMVVVTHELDSIFSIAHRVVMLDKDAQGIIAIGSPLELKGSSSDPRVTNFFNRIPAGENSRGV